jgi:hypothetical protein
MTLAMFLDDYLTEYDDSISGDSYIDPLGMLVIWSAFGQKIFKNRVNSISNDVRNYTLNLFNHYLTRRLIRDESVELSKALKTIYGDKDNSKFRYACLVYLEKLFVFSILAQENQNGVNSGGVLGIVKARRMWNEQGGNPSLLFTHDKSGHILVRQLSLGVSGRYKTPLLEIGYFDNNYHYQLPKAMPLWEEVEKFIDSKPALKKLANAVYRHFKEELLTLNSSKPQILFNDVPSALRKNYVEAFASPGAVGKYAREYWLKVTGLDSGAAGAMLKVLDENANKKQPDDLAAQQLIAFAKQKQLAPDEQIKFHHIEVLEPFLADATLMFTLLTTKKSQPLQEVMNEWHRFGRDANTLPKRAQRVLENPDLKKVLSGTALWRINKLLELSNCTTLGAQIDLLLGYHSKVMEGRGQLPWLCIDGSGLVKVHTRPSILPEVDYWPKGGWFNNYYIPQYKSLVYGYQGGGVEWSC